MQASDLNNVGVILDDLNSFTQAKIKNLCKNIKNNADDYGCHDVLNQFHRKLEGYNFDYIIPEDLQKEIFKHTLSLINTHESRYNYFDRIYNYATATSENIEFELERIWVNLQRKGEFLPVHNHSGVYSFVIWASVPFLLTEEELASPNPVTIKNRSGYFQFLYTDALGKISTLDLPVDKTWEGKICLFPAELHHQVYPFYSSDDIRISIAGNVRVKINV